MSSLAASEITLSSSIASSVSTLPPKTSSVAVLVKGPECRQEEAETGLMVGGGVLAVEPTRCQSVDLSDHNNNSNIIPSPLTSSSEYQQQQQQKSPSSSQLHQVPLILQAMFRGGSDNQHRHDHDHDDHHHHEEHELMEQRYYEKSPSGGVARSSLSSSSFPNHRVNPNERLDISHGYKYEFNQQDDEEEVVDGNCIERGTGGQGSQGDDDEDDEDDLLDPAAYNSNSPFNDSNNNSPSSSIARSFLSSGTHALAADGSCIHLLGRSYDPDIEYETKRDDELSLFWFTYRCDFPEIVPYRITSDAGWGCMLRSAQMLLGQALRVHFKSRNWKSHKLSIAQRRREPFLRSLLTWMADFPSSTDNVYSLHNMVAAGMARYEILPGEWYGPATACYVLRDLAQAHETRQVAIWKRKKQLLQEQQQQQHQRKQEEVEEKGDGDKGNNNSNGTTVANKPRLPDKPVRVFRVHVASQGAVYKDTIHELMTKESRAQYERDKKKKKGEIALQNGGSGSPPKGIQDHPLATAEQDLKEEQQEQEELRQLEWDTALLLLIPLRLGLKEINDDYAKSIAYTFSIPMSVGMLGGRPRGARWFYGAWADGTKILGLDPHTVQGSPRKRTARVNGRPLSVVDISEQYLRSVHTTSQESVPLPRMDPSIALGFYCKTPQHLQRLQDLMQGFKTANPNLPEIFTIAETSPDYETGNMISSSMMDDLLAGEKEGLDGEDEEDTDDEYVML